MITKYSSSQISLLNHAHLNVVEWVKLSDHEDIINGLKIILNADLNYQGAIADCNAYKEDIVKLKKKMENLHTNLRLSHLMGNNKPEHIAMHDAKVIQAFLRDCDIAGAIRREGKAYADSLENP